MAMNNYYQNMNGYPYTNRPSVYDQSMQMQNIGQTQGLKGRPVTSFEEARASMIDFDGSISYFPDLANRKIYTKQINMDGSPSFKVYQLIEQPQELASSYNNNAMMNNVTQEDFNKAIGSLSEEISQLKMKLSEMNKQEEGFRF